MEDLKYHLVIVHPNLNNDPVGRHGEIGTITSADLTKDEVYVGFGNNAQGLYSTDALLVLRNPNMICEEVIANIGELDIRDFKLLMEIVILQEKNSVNYLRDAMELAITNARTIAYSTLSLQKKLEVKIEQDQLPDADLPKMDASEQRKRISANNRVCKERIEKGRLPTISIEGQIFYIGVRMGMLRPKDEFFFRGIEFSKIEDFFKEERSVYIIPYNPHKKEFEAIDYQTITEIPKHLSVIEIPYERTLDPIGWNRQHGFDPREGLDEIDLQMHFDAKPAEWEEIYVPQMIQENLERSSNSEIIGHSNVPSNNSHEEQRNPGRRI